jgi:hypothetical protein
LAELLRNTIQSARSYEKEANDDQLKNVDWCMRNALTVGTVGERNRSRTGPEAQDVKIAEGMLMNIDPKCQSPYAECGR